MDEPQAPLTEPAPFDEVERERIMKHWDQWRAYIANGGGGSWPRDCFESLVDELLELRAALASAPHPTTPSNTLGDAASGPGDPVASLPTPPIAAGEVQSGE